MNAITSRLVLDTILAASLTGMTCGLMGVFITQMNLSSLGFCMSHAAFAGAALGLLFSINPLPLAMAFSILIAAILGPVAEKARLHANVVMGILFPLTMALGLIFLNLSPGFAMTSSALSLLWGSVLGISRDDIRKLILLAGVMNMLVVAFEKEFRAIMLDRKLAKASGIKTEPFYYLILFLTGVTVALSLRLVGGLLIFTLMTNPASTAYQLFYDIKKILIFSPLLGAIFSLFGILLSFCYNLPIGSSIAIVSTLTFLIAAGLSPKRRVG